MSAVSETISANEAEFGDAQSVPFQSPARTREALGRWRLRMKTSSVAPFLHRIPPKLATWLRPTAVLTATTTRPWRT
jgi:hypothetical protein